MSTKTIGLLVIMVGITGCSSIGNRLEGERLAEYHSMVKDKDRIETVVDLGKYEEAAIFMLSADTLTKDEVEEGKLKYGDLIVDTFYTGLGQVDIQESLDDTDNSDVVDLGDVDTETLEDGHPIYGTHFELLGYGTKDESDKSIAEWSDAPLNTIIKGAAYKDRIVFRVDSKVSWEFLYVMNLEDGKIISADIYR